MIDSHCHLADAAFADDLPEVVSRAREAGVGRALCILDAADDGELAAAVRVRSLWDGVDFATGVHPHRAGAFAHDPALAAATAEAALDRLADARALGEVGLDYHYDFAPREVQRAVFREQVGLARRRRLPLVIHAREAEGDILAIVEEHGAGEVTGVFHCFTGDEAAARRAVDLGFYVSLSGIVTFPKAAALRDVARTLPADRLLVETDSPYLAPVPYRGRRNEPAWVTLTADVVARERAIAVETLADQVARNFSALMGRAA